MLRCFLLHMLPFRRHFRAMLTFHHALLLPATLMLRFRFRHDVTLRHYYADADVDFLRYHAFAFY